MAAARSAQSKKKLEAKNKDKAIAKTAPVELSKDSESRQDRDDADAVEEESGSDDEDDDGVDEEGMERLMKALGEDGLDDFDRAQLSALGLDEDEEDSDAEEEGEQEADEVSEGAEDREWEISDEGEVSAEEDEGEESEEVEGGDEGENEENEEEEEIALDEAETVDEDAIPKRKIEIDNKVALDRIRESIALDPSLPWTETLVLSYPEKVEVDVDDDLNRELAFYKQALHAATEARALAAKHKFPFTRPSDYFAEMVKSDAHMERIRQRLLDESASIKKSEEKRKEREGKKFGKQVQLEKLKERERAKKDMEERLKSLKRKHKDVLENKQGDDTFDVAVEDAISDRPNKRSKTADKKRGLTRQARDKRFGFGGKGRRSKQNTKQSTDDFGSGSKSKAGKNGKGGHKKGPSQRPGKARRMAARGKK